jgi:hypothetical protein
VSCGEGTYSLSARKTSCLVCRKEGERGVSCEYGQARIDRNFWPFMERGANGSETGRVLAALCPPGLCQGGPALAANCTSNRRLPIWNNSLCGECAEGFAFALGSSVCVRCTEAQWGYVVLLVLVLWVLVLLLHAVSQRPSGRLKILLFFLSSVRLVSGPGNTTFAWLGILEQSTEQSWWNVCVLPLGPYGLVLLRLLLPAIGAAQLLATFALSRLALLRCCSRLASAEDCAARRGLVGRWLGPLYAPLAFLRTLVALSITSYTEVTTVVIETLQCVKQPHVVFKLPASNCLACLPTLCIGTESCAVLPQCRATGLDTRRCEQRC